MHRCWDCWHTSFGSPLPDVAQGRSIAEPSPLYFRCVWALLRGVFVEEFHWLFFSIYKSKAGGAGVLAPLTSTTMCRQASTDTSVFPMTLQVKREATHMLSNT